MVWGCFAALGPGQLAVINVKINSQVYQDILQKNVRLFVHQVKHNKSWVMQQDNDPKHRSKSTTEWLQQKKIRLLGWPGQSPDRNPTSTRFHTRHPKNIAELKQFCEDEWSKVPPDHCAGLIRNYRKHLVEYIATKGGSTSY